MEAHLLSLNSFSKPKVLSENNAGYINLIYLLLTSKGKYQSHPNMGVGLRERYRNNNDSNFMLSLQNDIKNQIRQFLPELEFTDITLTVNNHVLGIIIDTTEGAYVLAYNGDTEQLNAAASYVLDDL